MTIPQISPDTLTARYHDFVQFIAAKDGKPFTSFAASPYIKEREGYKYSVHRAATENLGSKFWDAEDIGTGEIQAKMNAAIETRVNHHGDMVDNNLVDWRKKDEFKKLPKSRTLEELLFNFYKNKLPDQQAFEGLLALKLSYQFIAYLFFIKNKDQFMPISQAKFDLIFAELGIENFKTVGQAAWENYTIFNNLIRDVRKFLRTKDKDTTLLDAHSFLWMLGDVFDEAEPVITPTAPEPAVVQSEKVDELIAPTTINGTPVEEMLMGFAEAQDLELFKAAGLTPLSPAETFRLYWWLFIPGTQFSIKGVKRVFEVIAIKLKLGRANIRCIQPAGVTLDKRSNYVTLNWPRTQKNEITCLRVGEIANTKVLKDFIIKKTDDPIASETVNRPATVAPSQDTAEQAYTTIAEPTESMLTVTEGRERLRQHRLRERNQAIVTLKKRLAREGGTLMCEVCNFSFTSTYGKDFIECHHRQPIARIGESKTTLKDLALVCANCHRMLHLRFEGRFLDIAELRERMGIYETVG